MHTRWFGVVVTRDGNVEARRDFPRDARAIADRLLSIRRGEVLAEERELAGTDLAVTEARLQPLGRLVESPAPALTTELPSTLQREAALLVARDDLRERAGERDRFLVQAVRALDEITKTANTLTERLRDWYALHYPEALKVVGDGAKLAQALAQGADRDGLAQRIPAMPRPDDSLGTPFTTDQSASVQSLAASIATLHSERTRLEALLEREAREVAPTLAALTGPLIAARLMSLAQGLDRLAAFPSSTVQTLGAENALFLHLKEGKKPPKHGVIFQHPLIHGAPRWQRGRVSRLMANHASMAARHDAFMPGTPSEIGAHFEKRLAHLRTAKPPAPMGGPRFRRPGGRR